MAYGAGAQPFLARAIASDPELYLLDEPVTGVDPTTQEKIMNVLDDEAKRGRTVIATTHDLACAAQRFHDVVALAGRVVARDPDDLALAEARRAHRFRGTRRAGRRHPQHGAGRRLRGILHGA